MNGLSSQMSVDCLFPSEIRLLPPDIARQIELNAQSSKSKSADSDTDKCVYILIIKVNLNLFLMEFAASAVRAGNTSLHLIKISFFKIR